MSQPAMRVVGLHKLPPDKQAFARVMKKEFDYEWYLEMSAEQLDEELEDDQYWDGWSNAWLVVVEFDGQVHDLDFDEFHHGPGEARANQQAAWEEKVLDDTPNRVRAAFWMHFVDTALPLFYGDIPLDLPEPTPMPEGLLKEVPYFPPD